ncbi:ABC transporter permease subunit [Actinoallomurus sp. NPDC050550]|uniref:ABC transporter permease subunit n=1 Tax=Actinoallomurus sp. NPDC050550 TaxID=3154937 RepID=UPI0033F9208F
MSVTEGLAARTAARELARQRRRYSVRHVLARSALYATAVGAALLCAVPFLWSAVTAVRRSSPDEAGVVAHVRLLLRSTPFPAFVGNTLVVGVLVTVFTLLVALPAAYALTRPRWGGAVGRTIAVLVPAPAVVLVLPFSWAAHELGLGPSLGALVLVQPTLTIPVAVLLFGGFLRAVPAGIEDQALVDGHGRVAAFLRVVLPQLAPAIAAVAVLAFTLSAGDFVYARALAPVDPTVATGIPARLGSGEPWAVTQTGVLLVAVPLAAAVDLVLGRIIAAAAGTAGRTMA